VSLNGCHIIYHVNFLATTLLKKWKSLLKHLYNPKFGKYASSSRRF
jgi:hypothetical protein